MTRKPSISDLQRRETLAFFGAPHLGADMVAVGLDADPTQAADPQPRRSPNWTVNFYFAGQGRIVDDHGEATIAPGTVVLRRADLDQEVRHEERPRYGKAYLSFSEAQARALLALGLLPERRTCWTAGDGDRLLRVHRDLLRGARRGTKPMGGPLWLDLVAWLVAAAPRRDAVDDALDLAARLLLEDRAREQDLHHLARRAGMAYHTFRRRFRERYGQGPASWRLHERMRQACHLLPTCSVQEVAEILGYTSPFTFSTQFRRSMGCSPREWLQRQRR